MIDMIFQEYNYLKIINDSSFRSDGFTLALRQLANNQIVNKLP
jgi:hypothetical protein